MSKTLVKANEALKQWRIDTFWERFWRRVSRIGPNGCWTWIGSTIRSGYGMVCVNSKNRMAHRISYESIYGPIADGLDCCHRCDNPPCVNPKHLFLGTASDNVRDAIKKGRFVIARRAYLPTKTVESIRKLYPIYKKQRRLSQLAKEFKVSDSSVYLIGHNKY